MAIKTEDGGAFTKQITVLEPPLPPLQPTAEVVPNNVFLYTPLNVFEHPAQRTTVDWGDGHVQDVLWKSDGVGFKTVTHDYLDGHYTATITQYFEGAYCSYNRTTSATFSIPFPGVPVGPSTWGRIKALYRD